MEQGSFGKLTGTVECDETWIGGKATNMHTKTRKARGIGKNAKHHHVGVPGMLERKGKVRAKVISSLKGRELTPLVKENVQHGSTLYTDDAFGDGNAFKTFDQDKVVHSALEYVRGNVHTNSIENFWSLFKRTIKGTYVSIQAEHLQKYVEEQCFRFKNRKNNDQGRFMELLKSVGGKVVTYQELIGGAAKC